MSNIVVTNLIESIREDANIGKEVAVISVADIGVSISSITIESFQHVDYGGITGWEDYAGDLFEVVGTKVLLKADLDYEKYWDHPEYQSVNFTVTATLSNGTTATASSSLALTDVIEEIRGTGKSETIAGTGAKDKIIAGAGNDKVFGYQGDDVIYGGNGQDKLYGGEGSDTFLYKSVKESAIGAHDLIMDWDHEPNGGTRDVIDLRAIDARSDYFGDQPFKWLGIKGFDGKKGELNYKYEKDGDTHIYGDLNGDKKADFEIVLDGKHKMYADDFFL
ncbi:calcium-binding protein [Neorhizobium alkalisoli]|uniref:Hemolysin type calcium-binding protein n=1 Tax=Neorhizobium alkalisoli TaxID=528178 RepID=A0A561Q7J4_9HYPH|nr:hypothetical protein [Neorhizobium alkalisoli]TWF46333.1 hemolysin type calcium-binding protein [Neorhizobium alkalisoli]